MLCLTLASDGAWANAALSDLPSLLIDHAHCEKKAAFNALSLARRCARAPSVEDALVEIATEEEEHFGRVVGLLERRGLVPGPPRVDRYAAALRRASAKLPPVASSLVDRLLVAALIEARSCERFKLLVDGLREAPSVEGRVLGDFYEDLLSSEARHYRTFVDLAILAASPDMTAAAVGARLSALAHVEAQIVAALPDEGRARATIHG
jgi:tRNA-(ms[2]io[6]A)-hydroxylase